MSHTLSPDNISVKYELWQNKMEATAWRENSWERNKWYVINTRERRRMQRGEVQRKKVNIEGNTRTRV